MSKTSRFRIPQFATFPLPSAIPHVFLNTTQRIPHIPLQKASWDLLVPNLHSNRLSNCHNDLFYMESVSSNSPSPHHRSPPRFKPIQPVADRIIRALRHHLRLLHRSEANFFILGATANVYIVTLSATPSCTCPDRTVPCKHILFVFIRVLGMSIDDTCLRRRTLRPCQLSRLLGTPTSPDTLAGARVRERFHQLFTELMRGPPQRTIDLEDGATCPICLEDMVKEDGVVACGACRNPLHEECLRTWKRSRGRRSANCVICRARWKERVDQERYLNLAAYVSRDGMDEGGGLCGD